MANFPKKKPNKSFTLSIPFLTMMTLLGRFGFLANRGINLSKNCINGPHYWKIGSSQATASLHTCSVACKLVNAVYASLEILFKMLIL